MAKNSNESAKNFVKRRNEAVLKRLEGYQKTNDVKYLKWLKDINRKGRYGFLVEAWTFIKQHNLDEKLFLIEKFKRIKIEKPITHTKLKEGDIDYRIGYYMVGKNNKRDGKWTWGESCAIIPQEDIVKIFVALKKLQKDDASGYIKIDKDL